MKKILFVLIIFLASCANRPLYKTGTYTIQSRTGSTTTFKNVKGEYELVSDTLKVGDQVLMINVKKRN